MGKLDELISELCPDGVNFAKLVDVAEVLYGYPCNAALFTNENKGMPLIRIRDVLPGKTSTYTTEAVPEQYIINNGDFLVGMDGNFNSGKWNSDSAVLCQRVCRIKSKSNEKNVLNGFLAHLLGPIFKKIENNKQGGTVKHLSAKDINEIRIPIPPLDVQKEIVRILDSFTLLTAELQAELQARKIQFDEYVNLLIEEKKFTNPLKMQLGDLFEFRNGLSKSKEFFGTGIPFIRYTDVYNNRILRKEDIVARVECTDLELSKLKVIKGDVLFTRTSETSEDVGWSAVLLDDIDECVFNGFTIKATPKTALLLPEYCAYCFSTYKFRKYVTTHCAFTTRASLTGKTISEYEMVIPSIEEQQYVVNILDKLYKLCYDLSSGLPAEIEARGKQYEFYRNKLLTFKELSV